MRSLSLVTTLLLAASAVTLAWGEDWPQFRGLNRDGKSPETGLLKEWPAEGLTPLWIVEGLGNGYSSVAVAGGMLFTTGMVGETNQGLLSAIDLSGKVKWQTRYGPDWDQMHPGTRSTPTVDGARLYELSGVGRLLCLDTKTGAILWSRDLPNEFGGEAPRCGFAEAPLIYKDSVICTPGGKDAALAALDKNTGKTLWTSAGFSDQSAYCSPILIERGGNSLIVTITARHVAGLDANTGKLFWSQPFDTKADDPNHSVAPVFQDGRLYVTSGHGEGGQMFEISPDGREATPSWTDRVLNTLHGGLVLVDGYVYGSNSRDRWVCLDLKSGKVMYEAHGVGMGSVAYADGMLYCYGDKGMLGLVRAIPTAHELISRFKVTQGEGPHWAHPVISGGRLYIRHGGFLMAYNVSSKQG
jgi:outer membrane protein assembly factor BamB